VRNHSNQAVLGNARVVLADRVIEPGWVEFVDGRIAAVGEGKPPAIDVDLAGDLLIPGLVELHTDHLEAHYMPRPKVFWDPLAAVRSYDAALATCGITTILDSRRIWREDGADKIGREAGLLADAVATARDAGMLRADHFLHLRCEVPMPDVVAEASDMIRRTDVRLLSLMDHTPGQRQFRNEEKLRTYYRGKAGGMTDAELDVLFDKRREYAGLYALSNYQALVKLARAHRVPLASHDYTTLEHVAQSVRDGVAIAEFPTTLEAARALHAGSVRVLMGAPNLMRGGSHSGNIGTAELAQAGVLDVLSSDYVPQSLLMGALQLPRLGSENDLASSIRMVTKTPAEAVGLNDRGEIAVGRRADLVCVNIVRGLPVVRAVWCAGERVA
jgi:alpha-D-ribose 1-methylphosphonate 5-triphosphate diphosphatase